MNNCIHCGNKTKNNKFCNRSCSASYNNVKFIKRPKNTKLNKCLGCGIETHNDKYCSTTCQNSYQKLLKIKEWENGNYIPTRYIKNILLKECENKCQLCGWGEKNIHTNSIPLELHHKDGNSENNTRENLIILCPNCHSLTENYKGANKESKRTYRKKYYKRDTN